MAWDRMVDLWMYIPEHTLWAIGIGGLILLRCAVKVMEDWDKK